MRKIAFAAIAALISTPALAADMAVKAPLPSPVYDWTGFYFGVTAGAGWCRPCRNRGKRKHIVARNDSASARLCV